jgi:hypothetical protein
MAKLLLVFSILIIAGAAILGFMTKGKVAAKVAELASTKSTLATTQATLKTTKADLETRTGELATAKTSIEDLNTKLASTETMLTAAKADIEKGKTDLAEKETMIVALNAELEKAKTPPAPGEQTANPAMVALQKEAEDAKNQAKEAKVAAQEYQNRQKAAEDKVAGLQSIIDHYRKGVTQAGLTGNVLTVNQGWNFVVIDVGDKQGVTVNSPLLVMRGGQRVATLKVTSVEPRQSIADVVPGTMARGTTVQVGDRVVFAGSRGQTTPPPPGGPAGPGAEAPAPPLPTGATPQ